MLPCFGSFFKQIRRYSDLVIVPTQIKAAFCQLWRKAKEFVHMWKRPTSFNFEITKNSLEIPMNPVWGRLEVILMATPSKARVFVMTYEYDKILFVEPCHNSETES